EPLLYELPEQLADQSRLPLDGSECQDLVFIIVFAGRGHLSLVPQPLYQVKLNSIRVEGPSLNPLSRSQVSTLVVLNAPELVVHNLAKDKIDGLQDLDPTAEIGLEVDANA